MLIFSVPARPRMKVCDSGTFRFNCEGPSPNLMSSQDLEELNLKAGLNKARYVCQELGEVIEFHIFLYSEDDKIVLTDIDGTITETDIKAGWVTAEVLDPHKDTVMGGRGGYVITGGIITINADVSIQGALGNLSCAFMDGESRSHYYDDLNQSVHSI